MDWHFHPGMVQARHPLITESHQRRMGFVGSRVGSGLPLYSIPDLFTDPKGQTVSTMGHLKIRAEGPGEEHCPPSTGAIIVFIRAAETSQVTPQIRPAEVTV